MEYNMSDRYKTLIDVIAIVVDIISIIVAICC